MLDAFVKNIMEYNKVVELGLTQEEREENAKKLLTVEK